MHNVFQMTPGRRLCSAPRRGRTGASRRHTLFHWPLTIPPPTCVTPPIRPWSNVCLNVDHATGIVWSTIGVFLSLSHTHTHIHTHTHTHTHTHITTTGSDCTARLLDWSCRFWNLPDFKLFPNWPWKLCCGPQPEAESDWLIDSNDMLTATQEEVERLLGHPKVAGSIPSSSELSVEVSLSKTPQLLPTSWLLPCMVDTAVGVWLCLWIGECEAIF